jgi:(1->4)-alpha-D-glucan 1-alpha-D-glucosylmutase
MRVPDATYRLQLSREFGFSQAKSLVSYLHMLGISGLYASPIFHARPGSLHGYDIVDPNRLNPELGSQEDFESLIGELHRYEMGWIQDIVPNHMAYDGQNQMLMDALESGQGSQFFDYFDIEWNHPYESLKEKILAPFLGEFYSRCLEAGEIKLGYDQTGLSINYYSLRLPLNIESYSSVLSYDLGLLKKRGSAHPDFIKFFGVLYALKNLPSKEERQERSDQIMFVKRMLWELYTTNHEITKLIDERIEKLNGQKGDAESFNGLDRLLSEQLFRLSFWKVATEEINYRRFFNINDLISLRTEDEKVFHHIHSLIFKLIEEEKIDGLRIDHIDGLYDPTNYLKRIRQKVGDLYVTVEKILALKEGLPSDWPVQGTTGYDFLNYVNGLFCETKNESRFTQIYARFTGFRTAYPNLVSEKKRLIIGRHMAGDIDGLAHLMKNISSRDRVGGDITLYGLKRALVEVLTFFPVYRSYINYEVYSEEDRLRVREALQKAKETNPGLLHELNFIERFLLLDFRDHLAEDEKSRWIHFVMRFQQLTGPLMAKGFEDTTLYVYNRLLSLNEVGGDSKQFGISVAEFHKFNQGRMRSWRHSMNATATHDTKRGEDVRARINVISELPEEWEKKIKAWSQLNERAKKTLKGEEVPDRNDEYFLYQTLIGAFPLHEGERSGFLERLKAYIIKAVREAKVHTEWLKPDTAYEEAFVSFIEEILEPSETNRFLKDFLPFAKKISHYGMLNSLAQTLIKIVSPGVPDFYQGTELWDLSFVDPDNRRPVDFAKRAKLLQEIKEKESGDCLTLARELLSNRQDSRVKLYVIYKALNFRRAYQELFLEGDYIPLGAVGRSKEHLCAFARRRGSVWVLLVVPRMITGLVSVGEFPLGEKAWGNSSLDLPLDAPDCWRNLLTGETLMISTDKKKKTLHLREVFQCFPVALFESVAAPDQRNINVERVTFG